MDPEAFDGAAGTALLLVMPLSVLFVAAALRRAGAPRWTWALYLLGAAGALVLLHVAGHTRYDGPSDGHFPWDVGQFAGLGLGRIGVAVNAVAATLWIAPGRRPYTEPLPRRENRLVVAAYCSAALATAVPATWWSVGLGIVPVVVELPVVLAGVGFLAASVLLRRRRQRASGDHERLPETVWPVDAVVAIGLAGVLAVGPSFSGSGLPDPSSERDPAVATDRPAPTTDPERPGPTPATRTSLGPAAVEAGTRALLEDTVRWAGPLDDLSSPTPAAAEPPAVALVPERCDDGGRRWTGSLVLPSARPQDLAPRVLSGWKASGYAPVDRAMGTDLVMPLRADAAVERMRLGGGPDGVHVTVESFCVPD